jgi:A/G-specific adenine glycosylase
LTTKPSAKIFQQSVLTWYDKHGRKSLPWQQEVTPYKVWLSEVMLQQTQVVTVIPYFEKFLKHFPLVADLAKAEEDTVLHLWAGLGYYSRARNLHKTAKIIHQDYQNEFPCDLDKLVALPGIGRSTAGAILSLGMQQAAPILDGNVKRVLTRCFCIPGWPDSTATKKQLWEIAENYTPTARNRAYTQAMMDLGAMVCTRSQPSCNQCPLQKHCQAFATNKQTEFPHKKPKKRLPIKERFFFIFQNERQELLLEKRPPSGIWGSLWCFPEREELAELPKLLKKLGLSKPQQKALPEFRHTFSHYHLLLKPILINVKNTNRKAMEANSFIWYKGQQNSVGLPKPISQLIRELQHDQNY